VFTWQVAGSGALGDLTTVFRDVSDVQPTLVPGDRIVADGSLTGGRVHLWTLPPIRSSRGLISPRTAPAAHLPLIV
jgi:hypothetical protein